MQKNVFFRNSRSEKLAGVVHIPGEKTDRCIIVCHGFMSSKVNKEEWCSFLAKRGFVVLRFDFNSHGESQGDFRNFTITKAVSDLKSAVSFMKRNYGAKKIGITGHSMGGQVIAVYTAKNRADAIAIASSPFGLGDTWITRDKEVMKKWEETGYRAFDVRTSGWKRERKMLSYKFILDRDKHEMENLCKKIRCPVLLFHGDMDEVVPVRHVRLYYNSIKPPKKLIILKGAKHAIEKKKDLDVLYGETAQWFRAYL